MRTIGVQYMRGLGKAYPGMITQEKMDLCRLVVFEAMQRAWRSAEKDEAMLVFFWYS